MKKREKIKIEIMQEISRVSKHEIKLEKWNAARKFVDERLVFYGRNGYMFNASLGYRKQLWQTNIKDDINMIACYVCNCNHITIDLDILTDNQKHIYNHIERSV